MAFVFRSTRGLIKSEIPSQNNFQDNSIKSNQEQGTYENNQNINSSTYEMSVNNISENIENSFLKKRMSFKHLEHHLSHPFVSTTDRSNSSSNNNFPGPGSYNILNENALKHKNCLLKKDCIQSASYNLLGIKAPRIIQIYNDTPSPGCYNLPEYFGQKMKKIQEKQDKKKLFIEMMGFGKAANSQFYRNFSFDKRPSIINLKQNNNNLSIIINNKQENSEILGNKVEGGSQCDEETANNISSLKKIIPPIPINMFNAEIRKYTDLNQNSVCSNINSANNISSIINTNNKSKSLDKKKPLIKKPDSSRNGLITALISQRNMRYNKKKAKNGEGTEKCSTMEMSVFSNNSNSRHTKQPSEGEISSIVLSNRKNYNSNSSMTCMKVSTNQMSRHSKQSTQEDKHLNTLNKDALSRVYVTNDSNQSRDTKINVNITTINKSQASTPVQSKKSKSLKFLSRSELMRKIFTNNTAHERIKKAKESSEEKYPIQKELEEIDNILFKEYYSSSPGPAYYDPISKDNQTYFSKNPVIPECFGSLCSINRGQICEVEAKNSPPVGLYDLKGSSIGENCTKKNREVLFDIKKIASLRYEMEKNILERKKRIQVIEAKKNLQNEKVENNTQQIYASNPIEYKSVQKNKDILYNFGSNTRRFSPIKDDVPPVGEYNIENYKTILGDLISKEKDRDISDIMRRIRREYENFNEITKKAEKSDRQIFNEGMLGTPPVGYYHPEIVSSIQYKIKNKNMKYLSPLQKNRVDEIIQETTQKKVNEIKSKENKILAYLGPGKYFNLFKNDIINSYKYKNKNFSFGSKSQRFSYNDKSEIGPGSYNLDFYYDWIKQTYNILFM